MNASYEKRRISLNLIAAKDMEPIQWIDSSFHPYYLTEKVMGKQVKKLDLFSQKERTLYKVDLPEGSTKNLEGWELDIDPALSYAYDKGLRFGILHRFENNAWIPQFPLNDGQSLRFDGLFGEIKDKDQLKYALLKDVYAYTNQPVPKISTEKLGLASREGSEEDYYNAFLLSRIANLPISRTYRNYTVSEWIRSMLHT
ncbi:MAG TPA: hypothetical protein VK503_05865, partial [Candidatus Bathyarchaeia archaeon]|nr:hypothetical protein [Candidatus Bathyarchaeia archaeon]